MTVSAAVRQESDGGLVGPALLQERVLALESELTRSLESPHPAFEPFYELMRYHVGPGGTGGKRFRPLLCLLLYEGWTGDFRNALPLAVAIELMHSFTLVHDDIEDGDTLRRARPAVWKICGVSQGINVGDALYSMAYDALRNLSRWAHSPRVRLRVAEIFARTTVQIAEGQYLDLAAATRSDPRLATYRFMAARKTGALIKASCAMGAALADTGRRTQFAAARFGAELGIAFQAFDDWKGMWGGADQTGKAGRADLVQRKITLPIVFALAAPGPQARELRDLWAREGVLTDEQVRRVCELVDQCGAETQLWSYAHERLDRARSELHKLQLAPRMAAGIDAFLDGFKPTSTVDLLRPNGGAR